MNLDGYRAIGLSRGRSFLVECLWRFVSAIVFQSALCPFYSVKRSLLRLFGARVGKGVLIKPRVSITFPWKLSVGNFSWIGEQVWIDNLDLVSIGDSSVLSQGVYICTGSHNYKNAAFPLVLKPIEIESQVWVGAKSILAPGIILQKGCVIAMGSVVTRSCESGMIYAGHPAMIQKVRDIES